MDCFLSCPFIHSLHWMEECELNMLLHGIAVSCFIVTEYIPMRIKSLFYKYRGVHLYFFPPRLLHACMANSSIHFMRNSINQESKGEINSLMQNKYPGKIAVRSHHWKDIQNQFKLLCHPISGQFVLIIGPSQPALSSERVTIIHFVRNDN